LKDDKSFLVIKIAKEEFPTVGLIRYKNVDMKDRKAFYFGPYPSGDALKRSLSYLRKIFPYRDCSKTKWNTYKRKGRPCIYGDIRVCTAPCNDWVNKAQYNKNILYLKNFLRGRKKEVVDKLSCEMVKLSKLQRFEEAALIRNKLAALDHMKNVAIGLRDDVFSPEKIIFKRIECYDISNIGEKFAVGSMVVFADGRPDKDEFRKFKIQQNVSSRAESRDLPEEKTVRKISPLASPSRNDSASDLSRLKQMLERRFVHNDWPNPDLVIIDGGETHLRVAVEVMKKYDNKIPVVSISKGPDRDKNDFHYGNSDIAKYFAGNQTLKNIAISARDEAHRFAISYYRKLHRKEIFNK
jgi:excinuclease ABC subunit C